MWSDLLTLYFVFHSLLLFKILLRDRETHEAIQDVELRSLELQAQRARIEQELAQRHDRAMHRLRSDFQTEQNRLAEPGWVIIDSFNNEYTKVTQDGDRSISFRLRFLCN